MIPSWRAHRLSSVLLILVMYKHVERPICCWWIIKRRIIMFAPITVSSRVIRVEERDREREGDISKWNYQQLKLKKKISFRINIIKKNIITTFFLCLFIFFMFVLRFRVSFVGDFSYEMWFNLMDMRTRRLEI